MVRHGRETIHTIPLIARDHMRVTPRAALITPVLRRNEPLHVGATIAAHPRRPGVAEHMEGDEAQAERWRLPAGRAALRAGQPAGGHRRAQQHMLEVAALVELEQALALVVCKVL